MARKYVFWRGPDGRPYRGETTKHAPVTLLAEIGRCATVNDEGKVTWPLAFHRLSIGVRRFFVILDPTGRELNPIDTWSILKKSIVSIIKKQHVRKAVPLKQLIAEANALAGEHFRQPVKTYDLVSTLSIAKFPRSQVTIGTCTLRPLQRRGSRFPYPRSAKHGARGTPIGQHMDATQYSHVAVRTRGITVHEATDTALTALSLLRGLWTVFGAYQSWSITIGSPTQQPIGIVHTGPIHTLHHLDGSLVSDLYWYDPNYTGEQKLFSPENSWNKIERQRAWAARRIRTLPYGGDLQDLIADYASALDHANLDVAFLQMWAILERVTGTTGGSYDDTIQRAVWIYTDREIAKSLLQALRLHRNQLVHAAKSAENRDQLAYIIKSLIEPHLLALLRNDLSIVSMAEYAEYLSMSPDVNQLGKRRRQIARAIGFQQVK